MVQKRGNLREKRYHLPEISRTIDSEDEIDIFEQLSSSSITYQKWFFLLAIFLFFRGLALCLLDLARISPIFPDGRISLLSLIPVTSPHFTAHTLAGARGARGKCNRHVRGSGSAVAHGSHS